MKIWVLNETKWLLFGFSAHIQLLYSIYLHRWVKKTVCLIFTWKQRYLVAYICNGSRSIELQKWKNLNVANTLKPKVLSYHWKLKTAISRFFFQIFHVNKFWWFISSNWIYPLVKNKSVKLSFVTKNSKHLVGASGNDSSVLIEFTPLWKTRVSNYPL